MPSEHRTGQGRRGGARRAPDLSFTERRGMGKSAPHDAWRPVFGASRRLTAGFGGRIPATWSIPTMCRRWSKTTRWLLKRFGAAGPRTVRRGHRLTRPPGRGLFPLSARQAGRRGGSRGGRSRAGTAAGSDERAGRAGLPRWDTDASRPAVGIRSHRPGRLGREEEVEWDGRRPAPGSLRFARVRGSASLRAAGWGYSGNRPCCE